MSLPILTHRAAPDEHDLLRLFYRSERLWCGHMGEETALEIGSAICNAAHPAVWDANSMLDLTPAGSTPAATLAEVEAFYASKGVRCASVVLNPSLPREAAEAMAGHLVGLGYRRFAVDVRHTGQPQAPDRPAGLEDVKVIPARASFRHLRALVEQWASPLKTPGFAEATMLHYDDPHYDALLALRGGEAVGHIGVFAMGEVGRIEDVYVAEPMRGRGLGKLLMERAVEICRRSLFRHVMLSVGPENEPAQRLYARFGLRKIGQFQAYRAPWTAEA